MEQDAFQTEWLWIWNQVEGLGSIVDIIELGLDDEGLAAAIEFFHHGILHGFEFLIVMGKGNFFNDILFILFRGTGGKEQRLAVVEGAHEFDILGDVDFPIFPHRFVFKYNTQTLLSIKCSMMLFICLVGVVWPDVRQWTCWVDRSFLLILERTIQIEIQFSLLDIAREHFLACPLLLFNLC